MKKVKLDTHIHMGCRTVNKDHEYNWVDEDLKSFKIPQNKSIFVFGGNNTNRADAANGNAKVIDRLLTDTNRAKTNIYSFIYDAEPIDPRTKLLTEEYEIELHQIFENMFKPLFLDRIGNLKEKQGIEKVLKNLVFVSHCGGSNFVNVLIDDLYDLFTTKYHPSDADHLIGKFQYFTYAPNVLPYHTVKATVITPFIDTEYSWEKVFSLVKDKRIDIDHPKGAVRKILKATEQGGLLETFDSIYKDQRIIIFRSDKNIYMIPSRINSNMTVGDHSIDCLVKTSIVESDSEYGKTAKILNYASKLIINDFASDINLGNRDMCEKIICKLNKNKIMPDEKMNTTSLKSDKNKI